MLEVLQSLLGSAWVVVASWLIFHLTGKAIDRQVSKRAERMSEMASRYEKYRFSPPYCVYGRPVGKMFKPVETVRPKQIMDFGVSARQAAKAMADLRNVGFIVIHPPDDDLEGA